ncbi:response regulator [Aquabacterium sp.]|uniref:response regulator n=1 Tax=Aquabacterium sp. TaxID=1872578 RepID=UPI0024888312|nr:response regulator [Aquabacterium sp.]MDI1259099.1 response regulator [Aquabacterium sp.]
MGQTVLVVDDNALNRELLRLVLEQQGYAVVEATTAEEALTMVRDGHPALVLMDCHLPGMDGLTATRQLKGIEATCSIPVVAVTAHAMPGDRERALAAGCNEYISKPVDFSRLITIVSKLVPASS